MVSHHIKIYYLLSYYYYYYYYYYYGITSSSPQAYDINNKSQYVPL